MKKIVIGVLLVALLHADELMLKATPFQFVQASIGQGRAQFIEVGSDHCYSCQIMGRLLYKIKHQNPKYLISFVNVKQERYAARALGIRLIPTQIIFDAKGKEVYRHIGLLKEQELLKLLNRYKVGE